MCVELCNGYTRAFARIMQHTHTHKAVTGRIEAKKVTPSSKAIKLYSFVLDFSDMHLNDVLCNNYCYFIILNDLDVPYSQRI